MLRRSCWTTAALIALTTAVPFGATLHAAETFPSKPLQIIVTYAPGGSTDFAARNLAIRLEKKLGQTVVVVNRPGASGTIGVMAAANAKPDGYTLLLGMNTEMVIIPQVQKVSYQSTDFEPIAIVGSTPLVLIGKKGFQADSFAELRNEIGRQPGIYNFGGAVGSPAHIAGEWLKKDTGLNITHVPYKGGAQAANDVAGGHLDLYFSGILPSKALIDAGGIRAYAVTSEARSPILPTVPTLKEVGLQDFSLANWTGLFVPRGTPDEITALLKKHVNDVLAEADFRAVMAKEGIDIPDTDSPAAFIKGEHDKFEGLLKGLGLAR